jgi:hypothetical protein
MSKERIKGETAYKIWEIFIEAWAMDVRTACLMFFLIMIQNFKIVIGFLLMILILLQCDCVKNAQSEFIWGNNGPDWGSAIACTKDNTIIVSGYLLYRDDDIFSFNNKYSPVFNIRDFTTTGELLWYYDQIQSNGRTIINDIGIDDNNNIYIAGNFSGRRAWGDYQIKTEHSNNSSKDIFLAKLDNSGEYISNISFGGIGDDSAECLYIDDSCILLACTFQNTFNLATSNGDINITSNGYNDCFVMMLDFNLNIEWIQTFGGQFNDNITGLKRNSNGEIIIVGDFMEQLQYKSNSLNETLYSIGCQDGYLGVMSSEGNLKEIFQIGGNGDERITCIAIDDNNCTYLGGRYDSNIIINDDIIAESSGEEDIYIMKFDQEYDMEWIHTIGGASSDGCLDIQLLNDNLYATGYFTGDVQDKYDEENSNWNHYGKRDAFLLKLSFDGDYYWCKTWGNARTEDFGNKLCHDQSGNIHVTGAYMDNIFMFSFDSDGNRIDNEIL